MTILEEIAELLGMAPGAAKRCCCTCMWAEGIANRAAIVCKAPDVGAWGGILIDDGTTHDCLEYRRNKAAFK